MKTQAWLGAFQKNAADSQALVIHFNQSGAMLLHLSLAESKPRILRYAPVNLDPTMTDLEKRNGFLEFLSRLKMKNYPPVWLVWADGMTFRQLELPPMPSDDLLKAVEWDLKKKYYFNPEENFLGFNEVMEIEGAEGPEKLFDVFYCEKNAASARLSFVQDLGLEIRSMIPAQAALAYFAAGSPAGQDAVVCERDGAFVRILVVRETHSMLARQIALGTQEIHLTDEVLKRIAEEVKKTIDFYESQKYFRPISQVLLAGAWGDEERACAFLGHNLETKVVRPDVEPYGSPSLSGEDREYIKNNGGLFSAALGAAILNEDGMNLVPADIKTKNRERRLRHWLNLALLGAAFLFFLAAAGISANTQLAKAQMASLQGEYEEIHRKKQVFEQILGLEKVRRTIIRGEVYTPSLLKDLSYRTPSIITLNELQYSRQEGTFILRGEILDSTRENVKSVTQYAATLSESPFFTSVNVSNTSHDEERKALVFELNCVVRGLL